MRHEALGIRSSLPCRQGCVCHTVVEASGDIRPKGKVGGHNRVEKECCRKLSSRQAAPSSNALCGFDATIVSATYSGLDHLVEQRRHSLLRHFTKVVGLMG